MQIESAINDTVDVSRKITSYFATHGVDRKLLNDVAFAFSPQTDLPALRRRSQKNLEAAKEKQATQYNKNHRPNEIFHSSDQVLLSTENLPLQTSNLKMAPDWVGPFTVLLADFFGNYTLNLPKESGYSRLYSTFNTKYLKRYHPNNDNEWEIRKHLRPGPLPELD